MLSLAGQSDSLRFERDSTLVTASDSLALSITSLDTLSDSMRLVQDSLNKLSAERRALQSKSSPDALTTVVNYGARDTQWYDHKLKQMHLFGEAYVEYGSMRLTAGYIVFGLETNEAEAFSIEDGEGNEVQKPKFKDGEQEFNYERLKYNFETGKGLVYQAVTTFTDLYVLGAKTKFVGANGEEDREDDVIYNSDALITSCNHEHPHFGIRTKQLKVIPKKVGVTGPANLELGGVPTPLWLPFGFFPLAEGRSAGLIFPSNFPYQASLGFGVKDLGWYFPINDYMDLQLTVDYYTRGSWGVKSNFRYKKRYGYNGSLRFEIFNSKEESTLTAEVLNNFSGSVNFTHSQDSKAHPYQSLGGSINYNFQDHQRTVDFDPLSQFTTSYSSNFYYKHKLPNLPYSLDLGLKHRQNTQTKRVDVTFPDLRLTMQTIYPFKKKNPAGKEKWYEKINMSGSTRAANFVESTDSTLFTRETIENMRSGVKHQYTANVNLKFLKYFSANPNVRYTEDWVFKTLEKEYFPTEDSLVTNFVSGFDSYRALTAGVNINTTIFGMIPATKGWFRGLRHTMKPSIGYNINPDTREKYNEDIYYQGNLIETYSRFDQGPFGSPSFTDQTQSISFGATNVVEVKYYSKKHEEERKFKILNQLNINGGYNFEADSLKWSQLRLSGTTNLIKNLTTLRFNFNFDPYLQDGSTSINQLVSSQRKAPVRLDRGSITLNSGISIKKLFDIGKSDIDERSKPPEGQGRGEAPLEKMEYQHPKLVDLIGKFTVDHNLVYSIDSENNQDSIFMSIHTLGIRGSIPITENWDINVGNIGYDFKDQSITYPFIGFTRKLHCWNMSFNWAPSAKYFGFFIGVNGGTLDFLKYNYGQNNVRTGVSSFR